VGEVEELCVLERVGVIATIGMPVLELAAPGRMQLGFGRVRWDAEDEVVIG